VTSDLEKRLKRKISVEFRNTPIEDALMLMAELADVDIVKSPAVTGSVTVKLTDVPLGEALDNILAAHGYGYAADKNMIRVAKADEISQMAERIISRIYRIRYANVKEVESALRKFISKKGSISSVPSKSNIIVTDTESQIKAIDEFIEEVDRAETGQKNSELLPVTRQKLINLQETLKRDKLTPWLWFNSRGVKVTRFDGGTIDISGGGYGSSQALVFFSFIVPFLKDAIVKTLDETLEICRNRGLEPEEPYIRETAMLLDSYLIDPIYRYMADIDRRIRGRGYPKSVARKDVTNEIDEMVKFLDKCKDEMIQGITAEKPVDTEKNTEGSMLMITVKSSKDIWKAIKGEYDTSKRDFGKKINFVSDSFKKKIIFRDIEHAFVLASQGFSKPALILAGGVIEELLRLYLKHKNTRPKSKNFDGYIKTCEDKVLLKRGVYRLSDSIRDFRNLVHLENEETNRHTVSKATAKGAVSSIFTIANDFR